MNRVTDESDFRSFYHAAMKIYDYIEASQKLSLSPWGFDVATFSIDGTITHAHFSCTSDSGWGNDELIVTAIENNGSFILSHQVKLKNE